MEYEQIFVSETGSFAELPVVGYYGTFANPVVLFRGDEFVADLCFMDEQGNLLDSCCQSVGCDYCNGNCSGCRISDGNARYSRVYAI